MSMERWRSPIRLSAEVVCVNDYAVELCTCWKSSKSIVSSLSLKKKFNYRSVMFELSQVDDVAVAIEFQSIGLSPSLSSD